MSTIIPNEINSEEVLARYTFDRDFIRKSVQEEKLIIKDIFVPNQGGVSLQRTMYCTENKCKSLAKSISSKKYIGFLVFKKSDFLKVKKDYIQNSRVDFKAEIVASPLDENSKYLDKNSIEVFIDSDGNPAHADLIYTNPAILENETPNIAYRSFSRKLSKACTLIVDESPELDNYVGVDFKKAI